MQIFSIAISAAALIACAAGSPMLPGVVAQTAVLEPAAKVAFFYGHPVPTISAAAAFQNWHACIVAAAARLDDHKSSVMDIALAIEPLCSTKEETMIDAINIEYLVKNPGIASNMTPAEMERVRKESQATFRQTIGTFILALRKSKSRAHAPR